jgi:hypothetical protein
MVSFNEYDFDVFIISYKEYIFLTMGVVRKHFGAIVGSLIFTGLLTWMMYNIVDTHLKIASQTDTNQNLQPYACTVQNVTISYPCTKTQCESCTCGWCGAENLEVTITEFSPRENMTLSSIYVYESQKCSESTKDVFSTPQEMLDDARHVYFPNKSITCYFNKLTNFWTINGPKQLAKEIVFLVLYYIMLVGCMTMIYILIEKSLELGQKSLHLENYHIDN